MKKFFVYLTAAVVVATSLTMIPSCTEPDSDIDNIEQPDNPDAAISSKMTTIDWDSGAHSVKVQVESNVDDWTYSVTDSWIKCEKSGTSFVVISVDESDQASRREGKVILKASQTARHTITVSQRGWGKKIELTESSVDLEADSHEIFIEVLSNFYVTADCDADWITETEAPDVRADHPSVSRRLYFKVALNEGEHRTATISIREKGNSESEFQPAIFTVTQKGSDSYSIGDPGPVDENFDPLTLFTDYSCSELKEGVTAEDIEQCRSIMHRNIARWILEGTYSPELCEFRIADYRAYDDPYVQSRKEVAVPYSIVDNPTGMVVEKDEELVVLAELHGRTDVNLMVIEFDRSAYSDNGYAYRNQFKLVSGLNRIKMPRPGMLYIVYNVEDWSEAPQVRVHFAGGAKVNGYYDSQKHGPERARELLNNARNYGCFDVMGRFTHLVAGVGHFRSHTSDLYDLAEIYDEMVYRQQVLCGLMRNRGKDEFRHNRILIYVSYNVQSTAHAFMADCFIAVPARAGSVQYMLQNQYLRSERIAEMAHEVGHVHSNWFSRFAGTMTEVTNNNLQMYTVCSLFGGEGNIKAYDGYTIGWKNVIVPKASHHAVVRGYSYEALAPLWALELYFGNVLGMTPKRLETFADDMAAFARADEMSKEEYEEYFDGFYPRLYDYMRDYLRESEANKQRTNAQYMMQFAVGACHAAKMDLTDYFTKWGFFTGEPGCEVNEADREAALQEIADAGYPRVTDAVEYITDDTWQLFRDHKKVVAGTATVTKEGLKLNGCSNVVAYELYDGDTLIRALNHNSKAGFNKSTNTFTGQWGDVQWQEGYNLKAVQYDGERVNIPVTVN